jgi:Na+/H+ antiporter NhaA
VPLEVRTTSCRAAPANVTTGSPSACAHSIERFPKLPTSITRTKCFVGRKTWDRAAAGGGHRTCLGVVSDLHTRLRGQHGQRGTIRSAPEALSPLDRLIHAIHPWVAFAIMPVFALANAGVAIKRTAFGSPVALSVALALVQRFVNLSPVIR